MKINNNILKNLIKESLNEKLGRGSQGALDAMEVGTNTPQARTEQAVMTYLQHMGYTPGSAPEAVQRAAVRYGEAVGRGENPQLPARGSNPVAPVEPAAPVAPVEPAAPVAPVEPAAPVAPVEPAAPVAANAPVVKPKASPATKPKSAPAAKPKSAPEKKSVPKSTPQQIATVKRIQALLNLKQDGVYGPQTRAAVNNAYKMGAGKGFTKKSYQNMNDKLQSELGDLQAMLRENFDKKVKNYVKRILKEAAMSQPDMVKAIQQAVGVTPDGVYGRGTQTAVTNFYRSRGIAHHGHTDWASKIQEEYNEIVGGGSPAPAPPAPPAPAPTDPTGADATPAVCRLDTRTDDAAKVQQLTQQIIDSIEGLMDGGPQIPATYGAKINSAVNDLAKLSTEGRVAEIYAAREIQRATGMSPKANFEKIREQTAGRPTGAAVLSVIVGLNRLEDTATTCASAPGGAESSDPVCRIDGRTDDAAQVQQITQEIIDSVEGLLNNGPQIPATYGAKINAGVNNLKRLSTEGRVAEVYVVREMQRALSMTPAQALEKLNGHLGRRPTGAAVLNVIKGLKDISDVGTTCGGGRTVSEGKVIFKKSYIRQVIREELEKVKKKIMRIR